MNCEQCLAELATGSLRDLGPQSEVVRHYQDCPECAPVATLLRQREYEAANLLNNLPPMSNPITVAEAAARMSHRRRVGRVVTTLVGAALAASIWIAAMMTDFGPLRRATGGAPSLYTETILLSCLSPAQAGDIINPYVRARGSIYYVPSTGISAITVRGTSTELAKSRELIREFESAPGAACRTAGAPVPTTPTP
ncbi:MAG: hypothetical protein ACJ8AE_01665 [Gemmatimonadaceae bacterium]